VVLPHLTYFTPDFPVCPFSPFAPFAPVLPTAPWSPFGPGGPGTETLKPGFPDSPTMKQKFVASKLEQNLLCNSSAPHSVITVAFQNIYIITCSRFFIGFKI